MLQSAEPCLAVGGLHAPQVEYVGHRRRILDQAFALHRTCLQSW
jgi:hypothetical protein